MIYVKFYATKVHVRVSEEQNIHPINLPLKLTSREKKNKKNKRKGDGREKVEMRELTRFSHVRKLLVVVMIFSWEIGQH